MNNHIKYICDEKSKFKVYTQKMFDPARPRSQKSDFSCKSTQKSLTQIYLGIKLIIF